MGVEADESDEVDDGDDENSVEMESLDPLALSELVSAGPKQLSTTGRYASPWKRPKATTPKNNYVCKIRKHVLNLMNSLVL